MKFVALDFETANSSRDSICQIGVVVFDNHCLVETWQTLVNPEDRFDWMNVRKHGITAEHVKDAPRFPDVFDRLSELLTDQVVVHHSAFDTQVLTHGREKYKLRALHCQWLDTMTVAQQAWPEFAERGYGLKNLAQMLGIDFQHHSAHEDARAAGEVLIKAIQQTRLNLAEWLIRIEQPISPSPSRSGVSNRYAREGNPDGVLTIVAVPAQTLAGKTIVVTGRLQKYTREEIEAAITLYGGRACRSVGKKTNFVLAGDKPGGNLEKAKQLGVKVIDEAEFGRMIAAS